jgi:hypothetical protein
MGMAEPLGIGPIRRAPGARRWRSAEKVTENMDFRSKFRRLVTTRMFSLKSRANQLT